MPTPHVQLILGSTRQARFGEAVAGWFHRIASARTDLTVELLDLRDWPLAFLDAHIPPAMAVSADPDTRRWADRLSQAQAYVLLTPEYNHGPSAVLKNALDHVYEEWRRKPVGFVSWGGPGGGVRAVEQLRQITVELQMAPMRQQVAIPNVYASFDPDGNPIDPRHAADAAVALDELMWWTAALTAARDGAPLAAAN